MLKRINENLSLKGCGNGDDLFKRTGRELSVRLVFSCHPFPELGRSLNVPKAMERKRKCTVYIFSEHASWRDG